MKQSYQRSLNANIKKAKVTKKLSLREPINKKCKDCMYDPAAPGTWLQQVSLCPVFVCPLHPVRPITRHEIPGRLARHYGMSRVVRSNLKINDSDSISAAREHTLLDQRESTACARNFDSAGEVTS